MKDFVHREMGFRSLTDWELELVTLGLEMLRDKALRKEYRDGARMMLEQKMPENFLWRDK
jgi:hypothetical protein